MCFVRKSRKANVPVENPVAPGSIEWYMREWAKDAAVERYCRWLDEQLANKETARKIWEYEAAMNALVEEIFGKKAY